MVEINFNADLAAIEKTLLSLDVNVENLTSGQINRALDRLDKASSKLTDVFIAIGRGDELPSTTFQQKDDVSLIYRRLFDLRSVFRNEVSRRYGPGAPSRLPLRGGR